MENMINIKPQRLDIIVRRVLLSNIFLSNKERPCWVFTKK